MHSLYVLNTYTFILVRRDASSYYVFIRSVNILSVLHVFEKGGASRVLTLTYKLVHTYVVQLINSKEHAKASPKVKLTVKEQKETRSSKKKHAESCRVMKSDEETHFSFYVEVYQKPTGSSGIPWKKTCAESFRDMQSHAEA